MPRPWKFSWVINFQKAGTFAFLLVLLYTAMQSSYGLVWILNE